MILENNLETQKANWARHLIDKIEHKLYRHRHINYEFPTHLCINPADLYNIRRYLNLEFTQQIGGQMQLFGLDIIITNSLVEGEVLILG